MAPRRKKRASSAQLAFEALSIEGGLLTPDSLSRIAQLQAGSQSDADYRIPKGLNLRDEIGRYWRVAQAYWTEFEKARTASGDARRASETFVLSLLREAFGFASLTRVSPSVIAERSYPIGHAALAGRAPVVIAPAAQGLDSLAPEFGDGSRRRSAFGLVQEFLNAQDGALWGIASDGVTLRIARDNASLTRPAWIEADLQRIFAEERYAEFTALWLLMHETRFGRDGQASSDCPLETWRNAGREEGTRAREYLRRGVEDALLALGQGFLSHPLNAELRASLQSGALTTKDYFNQLLRLVYRMIFLLTVEERGLLHPTDAPEEAVALYARGYSIRRLRERSARRNAHDRFTDLWDATKIVFRALATGEPRLGLPALAGLFAPTQCPTLDTAKLENRSLLLAMFNLAWLREDGALARVNWRDMGPEELGSVYESLLELVPHITDDGRRFALVGGAMSLGHARKETSSYYTHDALVQTLLDQALEPAIADAVAARPDDAAGALLDLSIVDPACGSGHFLLGAARRLALHVARFRANGTPSADEYRRALRSVVARCIYGVDLNPMAVELCKVSLWMEAVAPGLPLTFLDAHIQQGNALFGASPTLIDSGIPDAAWDAVSDDDKMIATALKKRNKAEAGGQRTIHFSAANRGVDERQLLTHAVEALERSTDNTVAEIAAKETQWNEVLASSAYEHQKLIADAWCAAFAWPKQPGALDDAAPTNEVWRRLRDGEYEPLRETVVEVKRLAKRYGFFHWHLQFPKVHASGGFDVVLGNPPWKPLSPDVKEFFSVYDPSVRNVDSDTQTEVVERLLENPAIRADWESYCDRLYRSVHFFRNSGEYRLFAPGNLGKGDFNIYRMFVERALGVVRSGGYASQIVPENLYNGANAMAIRKALYEEFSLVTVLAFENTREVWFKDIDSRAKFCIYVAKRHGHTSSFSAAFGIRTPALLAAAVSGAALDIPVALVSEFSPDALAVMEFRSQLEIAIAKKMYARWPKFGEKIDGLPYRDYMAEVHMGADRELFTEDPTGVPVYEGRMVWQFDHRAKAYKSGRGRSAEWSDLEWESSAKKISPQWYISRERLPEKTLTRVDRYRIGFCDVASPTNERTFVAAVLPPETVAGHSVPTILFDTDEPWLLVLWVALANSFVLDFLARFKTSLHMTFTIVDSLPIPRRPDHSAELQRVVWLSSRLTCVGEEMRNLWVQLCNSGWLAGETAGKPNGLATPIERLRARAELDALIARHLFDISKVEMGFILDTFPTVAKYETATYREFMSKRLVLEHFDN